MRAPVEYFEPSDEVYKSCTSALRKRQGRLFDQQGKSLDGWECPKTGRAIVELSDRHRLNYYYSVTESKVTYLPKLTKAVNSLPDEGSEAQQERRKRKLLDTWLRTPRRAA